MKKKFYSAVATVRNAKDSGREWEVVIYSLYENIEEAQLGIEHFKQHYKGTEIEIVKAVIK